MTVALIRHLRTSSVTVSAGPLTALASISDRVLTAIAQYMSQLPIDHDLLTETDHQQGNRGYEENVY